MRRRLRALFVSAAIQFLFLIGAAHAQQLCVPPPSKSALWCDQTFSITTSALIQGAPTSSRSRQRIQIQNNSAAATNICVICFGAAARGVSCSATNGGTYLGQGQAFSLTSQQLYGLNQIDSIYFNSDISAFSLSGTCTLSVSIDG